MSSSGEEWSPSEQENDSTSDEDEVEHNELSRSSSAGGSRPMEPSLQGAPHSDASPRHLRIPAALPCPSEGADADRNGLAGASEGHAADAPVQATAAIPHRRNLHGALALVEGQVNIVHHNQTTDEYDLHNQENGGVGTQLGYDVTLGYVEAHEAMVVGDGGTLSSKATAADDADDDDSDPPPAPSSFASKCPKGVLFLVVGTGKRGWPKGQARRCISDGKRWRCEHGRERRNCKECGGARFCDHGRQRHQCKECGGASLCRGCKSKFPSFGLHGERRWCKKCTQRGGIHAGLEQAFNPQRQSRRPSNQSAPAKIDLTGATADSISPLAPLPREPAIKDEPGVAKRPMLANDQVAASSKRRREATSSSAFSDGAVEMVESRRSNGFARAWTPEELRRDDDRLRRMNCPGNPSHGVSCSSMCSMNL
jgi:hypothetical protein